MTGLELPFAIYVRRRPWLATRWSLYHVLRDHDGRESLETRGVVAGWSRRRARAAAEAAADEWSRRFGAQPVVVFGMVGDAVGFVECAVRDLAS